ncbi:transposon Ty3-I Gag-Pol polyprotein [Nephila pilipes]|uniref:Transposon Ty3-I Gag-Pol polyprotein n=1 Tax=Nephila pilipes TaxID=299642 RepID=A0A8X6U4M6_NEPPI|nr:transposon Ty3-I Gag-Pol polyprotein [Nephila pilipes]
MAEEQQKDSQLQDILADFCSTSLVLQPLPMGQSSITLHCDVSTDSIRPFVPEFFRREISNNLHALSYPGIRASLKLVAERYVWPSMRQDVTLWARTCLQCQHAKVSAYKKRYRNNRVTKISIRARTLKVSPTLVGDYLWRSCFATVVEGYKKGESKQSAGLMSEKETKRSLREGENCQSELPLLR